MAERWLTDAEVDARLAVVRLQAERDALHSLREARRERDEARAALQTVAFMRHVEQHPQFGEFSTCPVITCGEIRRALGESDG